MRVSLLTESLALTGALVCLAGSAGIAHVLHSH